jgi:hypothetical protein
LKQYIEFLESFVVIALAIAGLVGTSYRLFRDGGWADIIFGNVLRYHFEHPMIAIPLTALIVIIAKVWHDKRVKMGRPSKVPTLILYTLMAAGVYFIGHYAIVGTF